MVSHFLLGCLWGDRCLTLPVPCRRICNAGFLRSDTTCTACPTGQYSTLAGASTCVACANAPANAYYLQRTTTLPTSTDCPW